ncbi:DNA polymerase I [Paraurantiacibacter namhicola]|uniref:DNA polymerase I n=1 Tax=Paraurantiacibacter namhicola TaxID=645517 RepID=A0A1C7D4Y8_9SPHN|nr:DNA polymerase I [Paraurantiacibacter namhicola]ANU06530.1 DNA polymerase I [Paraurantiacibacter namhicola]
MSENTSAESATDSPKNHLYLVDGSAYIFRAYHRLPPLTNPEGTPVGAVYGYTTMLWKLAEDLDKADGPTHLAVILDKSSHSFRNDIYPEYKAHRPDPPEDLVPQFPLIRDATRAFSLPLVEEPDVEADDMIASYARAAQAEGWDVTIVSSDKDLMQLVGELEGPGGKGRIDMLDTMKDARIFIPEVEEKFGVRPEQLGDVLALMGDSVDNIPGIYGVGPKTASKLISENGSLAAALDAAPDMKKSKLKERLLEGRESAELSRVLVTLREDCPLPIALDDMRLDGIPPGPLAEFLEAHGFHSLSKRLEAGSGSPGRKTNLDNVARDTKGADAAPEGNRQPLPEWPAIDRSAYACVQDEAALEEWIARAMATRIVAVDTETSELDAIRADLVGVSLALGAGDACYIPLGHLNEGGGGSDMFAEKPKQVPLEKAIALLKPLLESDAVIKVFHNGKYDLNVLARHGIAVGPIDDTMIMSFDMDAGRQLEGIGGGHGMDELSERHLGHTPMAFKEVCGTGKKAIPFGEVPLDKATEYAAEDAEVTWRLYHHLKPRLPLEGAVRVYERVDRPLIPVVAQMERHGIKVDRAQLSRLSEEFATEMARVEKEIFAEAGQEFTIGSPKQLGEILFDKLGYKGGRKGKSGQYSTDQAVLEKLDGEGAAIASKVLEYRQLAKLKNTYTDALQAAINPDTGRVHTSYSLTGAQTGRLSSTDPNLQNIPIRTAIGRQIREAFVPEDGNVLLAADYSQIELRLAAHMADVDALKEAFAAGEDIHSRTAREMYGEVDRDTRAAAKTINFAILYGISRWGLAGRLDVEPDEAQAMIDRYFERFPGIQKYIVHTLERVREKGYSETLFGRKTWFPRITSKNPNERAGSERAAINAPIQGTSADIIKRAMARMMPALEDAGLGPRDGKGVRMLLQVHDELVFELPEGDVAAASPVIERVMAEAALPAVQLDVPLGIEIGHGASWDAAH